MWKSTELRWCLCVLSVLGALSGYLFRPLVGHYDQWLQMLMVFYTQTAAVAALRTEFRPSIAICLVRHSSELVAPLLVNSLPFTVFWSIESQRRWWMYINQKFYMFDFFHGFISLFQFTSWGIIYSEIMRSCLAKAPCFFGVDYYSNGKVGWGEYFDSFLQTSLNYSTLHSSAAEEKKSDPELTRMT